MKAYKVLQISILVFALLTGGLFTLQIQANTIHGTARCTPPRQNLDDPPHWAFKITLSLPKSYDHEDIDLSTIMVGGLVPMLDPDPNPDYPKIKSKSVEFRVDGSKLINWVVLPRIWHITPPPSPETWVPVDIEVTGQLYDTTPFEATFTLTVLTEPNEPPPPPP
jgi:hypothetical protein